MLAEVSKLKQKLKSFSGINLNLKGLLKIFFQDCEDFWGWFKKVLFSKKPEQLFIFNFCEDVFKNYVGRNAVSELRILLSDFYAEYKGHDNFFGSFCAAAEYFRKTNPCCHRDGQLQPPAILPADIKIGRIR